MGTEQVKKWSGAHSAGKLAAAWAVGIGGCDLLAWAGLNVFPGNMHPWMLGAAGCMLVTGVLVWRLWFPEKLGVFSMAGWRLGALLLAALLLHPLLGGGSPSLHSVWSYASLKSFLWCLVMIGLAEELWWRGIWFRMWKDRPVMCVLTGSLAFTAYHYPFQGFEPLPMVFFFGLAFAVARSRGASIGVLALAHGLINWAQMTGLITWEWRNAAVSPNITVPVVCLIITAVMLLRAKAASKGPESAMQGKEERYGRE